MHSSQSSAFLGGHSKEGGHFLLDLLAFAFRASEATLFVLADGHNQGEGLLAVFADELVAWHGKNPPGIFRGILTEG
jgi:hypothetical protein